MKYFLFFLFLLSCQFSAHGQLTVAHITPDTFRIQSFPLKIWYGLDRVKKPRAAEPQLLALNDAQINRDWRVSKNLRLAGTVVQLGGLVVEGVGLANMLNGKGDDNNLVLKGVGIMFGGVMLQVIANGPMKRAMFRHNHLKTQKLTPSVAPPIPTVFAEPINQTPTASTSKDAIPDVKQSKKFGTGAMYFGVSAGFGWSKQKLNYEEIFPNPLKHARVYTYGIQLGKQITETMAWQLELAFSEHGYRVVDTDYAEGVSLKSKTDARLRFLELPFLMAYQLPLSNQVFSLELMPGTSVGLLNSGKIVAQASGEEDDTSVQLKVRTKLDLRGIEFEDKLDAALLLGARVRIPYGPGKFFLEGRYHLGILNLDRNVEPGPFDEMQQKTYNRSFFLRTGFQIAI
ncbi:MAG: PorT family protein [Saprospiraceae bacterium]|nr:PorT family protein [Saprospiraceae bacterium]